MMPPRRSPCFKQEDGSLARETYSYLTGRGLPADAILQLEGQLL
jgi:hypothetical protein